MLRAPYRNTFDTMNSDWDYTNHLYRTEIRIYGSLVSICISSRSSQNVVRRSRDDMAVCFRPLQGLRWNKRSRQDRLKISRDYSNDPDEERVNAGAA